MASVTLISRPVGILALAILARLLDPADFGLVALAMVLFSTARLFSGLGMGSALIHNRRDDAQVAFPAFTVTVISALTLFVFINLNMEAFARLMGNADLTPIMRWLSLLIIFDAMAIVPESLLRKHMRFGVVSRSIIIRELVKNGVAIILAFSGFGLWSLVWGNLAGALVRTVMIWVASPGWSWLLPGHLNLAIFSELLHYGVRATGGSLVNFFNSNWDDWFVGRVLGAAALGFYSKAYNLTNGTIAGFNRSVLGGVFMPSYAKIQGDRARLMNMYLKGLSFSALIMAPLSMGVFAVAGELVPFLLGDKWLPMIPVLQIFAFMALIRPLAASTSPLFRAVGRPEFDIRGGLVVLVTLVPLVLWLKQWNIEGVAVAVTVSFALGFFFNVYQINRILPGVARRMAPAIAPSLIASGLMVGSVILTRPILSGSSIEDYNWAMLMALIAVGGTVYVVAGYLLQRALVEEVWGLLRSIVRRRKKKGIQQHQVVKA